MEKHYGKDIPKENIFKDPRVKKFFMRSPFIREISRQIEKGIKSFFAKLDFETNFLLLNDTYSLKNVFKHKEQQQILHQYGVVYEISCNCGSSYIGQTSRNLITRINNHDPSSKTPQDTDVTRHLTDNPNHAICFNNPIILARSDHWRKLLIKETLHRFNYARPKKGLWFCKSPNYSQETWQIRGARDPSPFNKFVFD